jgi:hypothetical protein
VRSAAHTATMMISALALVAAATGCGDGGNKRRPGELPVPSVSVGHSPQVSAERGPQPPPAGAWLGAWVKPEWSTPAGRADAFQSFEQQVGAQLPIAHNFQEWTDEFPGAQETALLERADILMVSWAGTDTRSIANGSYDTQIRQRAEAVKLWGRPLLLRFRWEMDRPNLAASVHSPADYIAAWKHTRQIFTEVGATNAGWVWCPHVQGFIESGRDAASYYPGDDQVEWLCTDVYAGKDFEPFGKQMNSFLAFAQQHSKPILIGEFGVTERGSPGQRAEWIREAHEYTKAHPQIKALVYFAAKQDRKPLYDTTFADDPDGLAAFRALAADQHFRSPVASKGTG